MSSSPCHSSSAASGLCVPVAVSAPTPPAPSSLLGSAGAPATAASAAAAMYEEYIRGLSDLPTPNLETEAFPDQHVVKHQQQQQHHHHHHHQHEDVAVDLPMQGLSTARDDYVPRRLARDPKRQRPVEPVVYEEGNKKRVFKKPREVSLVADYIRRFLRCGVYDCHRSVVEQPDAVALLLRKLRLVFPHGDWTLPIVQALIREKTKKKRPASLGGSLDGSAEGDTPVHGKKQRTEELPSWATALLQQVAINSAAIANIGIRRRNQLEGRPLQPLLKERHGVYDKVEALFPRGEMLHLPALREVVAVGQVPAVASTLITEAANGDKGCLGDLITQEQVMQLVRDYNDDMSITASDSLQQRVHKLISWLTL